MVKVGIFCPDGLPAPRKNAMWFDTSACEVITIPHILGLSRMDTDAGVGNTQCSIDDQLCDHSPTNAPASCSNPDPPPHSTKGANWKDTLPSGESNQVVCNVGFEATNGGKNTCDRGALTTSTECRPVTSPPHHVSHWTSYSNQLCVPEKASRPAESQVIAIDGDDTDTGEPPSARLVQKCQDACASQRCHSFFIVPGINRCVIHTGSTLTEGASIVDQMRCTQSNGFESWILDTPSTANRDRTLHTANNPVIQTVNSHVTWGAWPRMPTV